MVTPSTIVRKAEAAAVQSTVNTERLLITAREYARCLCKRIPSVAAAAAVIAAAAAVAIIVAVRSCGERCRFIVGPQNAR